ncbi:MAG: class I SAM-dependent methyltransferase [Rhizobiaceae bacterium]
MNIAVKIDSSPNYVKWNERLNKSWSSVDYARIGVRLQITGEKLAEAADFTPGSKVLDIAAGNGNASLAVARRFCEVTSTDYVQSLLDKGRERAEAEDLDIEFMIADAQDLPFADNSFDGIISTFGSMFAPDQRATAAELIRVCRPGGKIALASWTPRSFIGRLCRLVGSHMSASPGFKAPANWGRDEWLTEHFGAASSSMNLVRKEYNWRYHSAEHFLDYFRTYYGLVHKAFEKVGPEGEQLLAHDILSLVHEFNVADDGTVRMPSEYTQAVIVLR